MSHFFFNPFILSQLTVFGFRLIISSRLWFSGNFSCSSFASTVISFFKVFASSSEVAPISLKLPNKFSRI